MNEIEIRDYLTERDGVLGSIIRQVPELPSEARQPGFRTLAFIITEQQISLAAATAIFQRLETALVEIAPAKILAASLETLQKAGLSRQKINTMRSLALAVVENQLNLEELSRVSDDEVRKQLTSVKGIGEWTASIYLLEALLRPDILPSNDLVLARCIQKGWHLPERPGPSEIETLAEPWRPYRSWAVRFIWEYFYPGQQPV